MLGPGWGGEGKVNRYTGSMHSDMLLCQACSLVIEERRFAGVLLKNKVKGVNREVTLRVPRGNQSISQSLRLRAGQFLASTLGVKKCLIIMGMVARVLL